MLHVVPVLAVPPSDTLARLIAAMRRALHEEGGFTMDATGVPVRQGLAVCADPATILSFPSDRWPADAVARWLGTHLDRVESGDVHLGGWNDVSTRTVYLEISYVFPRHLREACLAVAVANRRRAVFDLGSRQVIDVPWSMRGVLAPAVDLERHRREYAVDGVTLLHDLFPPERIAAWRRWALQDKGLGAGLDAVADASWVFQRLDQRHAYTMIDGVTLRDHLPDMVAAHDLVPLLSAITLRDVVISPYPASGINVLVYDRHRSTIGWHHDTNLVTFLLYLTDNEEGGTECRLLPSRPGPEEPRYRLVRPRAGTALLMQGRWVLHRGLPLENEVKVACPWNYYSVEDQWRPTGFDDRIYGPGASGGPPV